MALFSLTTSPTDNLVGTPGESNFFYFTATTLQSTDSVAGVAAGPFFDTLVMSSPGTVTASQFAGVNNIEGLTLAN
jgi:hypothetical protein